MSVEMTNVSKTFPKVQALKKIFFEAKPNEITALIGFNGSGKTTTFNLLVKYLEQDSGQITYNKKQLMFPTTERLAYLLGEPAVGQNETPKRYFAYLIALHGLPKKEAWKKIHELATLLEFTPYMNKTIVKLSKGNRQKTAVIATFFNPKAQYYFLDEPFDGLDPLIVRSLKAYILKLKQNDKVIIITSHRMDIVDDMCDAYYILKDGVIVDHNQNHKNVTTHQTVKVSVNPNCDVSEIKKLAYVVNITKTTDELIIIINNIQHFGDLSTALVKCPHYLYHSLKKDSISDKFFEAH